MACHKYLFLEKINYLFQKEPQRGSFFSIDLLINSFKSLINKSKTM